MRDLKTQTFGILTVIDRAENSPAGKVRWNCRCRCGKVIPVLSSNLTRSHTTSCGCDRQHKLTGMPEYRVWCGMRQRCNDKNHPSYRRHGSRGIKVCDRWNDFRLFLADMGPRPSPDHTIERKDNDGNYEPGNCRWATWDEQAANRSSNRWITISGVTKLMSHWADEFGLHPATLKTRIDSGWPPERWFDPVKQTTRGRRPHQPVIIK